MSPTILRASLFAAGRLDDAVVEVLVPLWRELSEQGEDGSAKLQWLRYLRRGEHLKLRLQVEPALAATARARLTERVEGWLAALGPSRPEPTQRGRLDPPLDDADLRPEPVDRALLWTRPLADQPHLGGGLLLRDPRYAARFFDALGHGCERILAALSADGEVAASYGKRQALLRGLWVDALSCVLSDPEQWQAYLAYHRDWLVRFSVLRAAGDRETAERLLRRYDAQARSGPAGAMRAWTPPLDVLRRGPAEPESVWQRAVVALHRVASEHGEDEAARLDPYAADVAGSVLFRLLHQVANALGISRTNEACTAHLLLHSLALSGGRRQEGTFSLLPIDEAAEPCESPVPADFDFERDHDWQGLVAAGGPEGAAWVETYRRLGGEIRTGIRQAVSLLRARRFDEARARFAEVESLRQGLRVREPSVFHALGRFYYGGMAFEHFLLEQHAESQRVLDQALAEIRATCESAPYLKPFAPLAFDIVLKRARLARDYQCWREMEHHLRRLWQMMMGREPLFGDGGGRALNLAELADHCAALPDPEGRHRSIVAFWLDPGARAQSYRRYASSLYALPGLVLPTT